MAEFEAHRPVGVTVAREKLQIRTDLVDSELKEILDYINQRHESYAKYNLEASKKLALLALELGQQLFETRKQLHAMKVERDQLNSGITQISAMLDEGLESDDNQGVT